MEVLAQGVSISSVWGGKIGRTITFGTFIRNILTAAVSVSAIIVLLLFILGGYQMIASAGQSDPRGTSDAKQTVTWAVIGFIIVFGAYWFIRVIEIITDVDFITNPISIIIGG